MSKRAINFSFATRKSFALSKCSTSSNQMEIVQRTNGPVSDPSTQLFPHQLLHCTSQQLDMDMDARCQSSHSGWPGLVGHNLRETC